MDLGKKLIDLRKQNKMTQEEVAEELAVTRQTISNWELNQTKPDVEQLKTISKLYQISIDDLVENDIKHAIVERISNTERLAGLVYKILKWIIIIFLGFIIFMIGLSLLAILLFSFRSFEEGLTTVRTDTSLNCHLNEQQYFFIIYQVNEMPVRILAPDNILEDLNLREQTDINQTINEITNYFEENDGTCD